MRANSRFGSVRTISRKPPAAHSAVPTANGTGVPLNCCPMTKPIAAAPIVPMTPWTEEAVPAIAAICSIAKVPRFDEVKAKHAIVSAWNRMNTPRLS